MFQILDTHHGPSLCSKNSSSYCLPAGSLIFAQCKSWGFSRNYLKIQKHGVVNFSLQASSSEAVLDHSARISLPFKAEAGDGSSLDMLPHVRCLSDFQKEELIGKTVLVRFDSNILLGEKHAHLATKFATALSTIRYLHDAEAQIILMSSWSIKTNSKHLTMESVSAYLSSVLKLSVTPMKSFPGQNLPKMEDYLKSSIFLLENLSQFKEDLANSSSFAEKLSSGVDIFVNDAFFQSHKVLASTVGVTSFCYASVAGFLFEEGLAQFKKAFGTKRNPYLAVVGGGNLVEKAAALHYLVSCCDGLVFVGNMAFTIIHALGFPVPRKLVEPGAFEEALGIIRFAKSRNITLLLPNDLWCVNDNFQKQMELFPAHQIDDGWSPVALGPNSLEEITSLLSKSKKIVWIGPVKFGSSIQDNYGSSIFAKVLDKLCQGNCHVTVVGNTACKALTGESTCISFRNMIENASVVWEFLKGRKLHGLMALDRGYPFHIDWHAIYSYPAQPLLVDIGSGNGLFIFRMGRRKDMNFLGLELNGKLVKRCLETVHQSGIKNGYFIETNATSTFRSIVSSYPGELVLVTIQCPNPDFNRPEHRWRMVQRSLIEAIVDLLSYGGKVFLQSDIETVALRMKEQFLKDGKGKLGIDHKEEWLKENPFGVESDWEQHVVCRGDPMYRLMLSKSN